MALECLPHSAALSAAVAEFNRRMREGGSAWGFYVDPQPDWIPPRPGQKVWREYHLLVEDGSVVRGGFALKPQEWLIRGRPQVVTDWQGPFSEGVVNPRYATLGVRMMRDMLARRPLLYSWGHGGEHQPVVQMLVRMKWLLHRTPFCLRIAAPFRFLRRNRYLRGTRARRLALDALAFSGAGSIGLRALHAVLRLGRARRFAATALEVPRFEAWADEVWERARGAYAALGVRDAATMNALLPAGGWPPGIRLRVERAGVTLGWAVVMDNRHEDDARFGSLRVGSVIDGLALPEDAGEVIAAASTFLLRRGVDIVVSNQAHPAWVRAFRDNGYAVLPGRRLFAASPALQEALEPLGPTLSGLHLTNLDGHGPMVM